MSNPFKSNKFKDLQKKWYKRLEKSGFTDIEQEDGNLKVWESRAFQNRYDPNKSEAHTEYYRLAGQFFYDYIFNNKRDSLIWKMHAEGATSREIAATLRKKKIEPSGKTMVQITILQLEKEMLKKYGKQDNKSSRVDLDS